MGGPHVEERAGSRDPRRAPTRLSAVMLGLALVGLLLSLSGDVVGRWAEARYRFGVGVAGAGIQDYDVDQLRAGWYVDWTARLSPPEPAGIEYVQMVRLHQMTECWPRRVEGCPYTMPYTYTLTTTSYDDILAIAQANPGSLWLIGNEMDRRDWDGGGQDEMLPETYAVAYYELYHAIKEADPSAQIAIGGVVQPTPLRLKYLDRVLAAYESRYGSTIPVDVWNIHNMILPERASDSGADIPPGLSETEGRTYAIQDADNIAIFRQHILEFRQWMKEKGEREKPLIISEYSVLYPSDLGFSHPRIRRYLYATFDYLTTATDASLGCPSDGNRLVQRWAWYSLNDDDFEGRPSEHHLFDPTTRAITQLGVDYGSYPPDRVYLPLVRQGRSK